MIVSVKFGIIFVLFNIISNTDLKYNAGKIINDFSNTPLQIQVIDNQGKVLADSLHQTFGKILDTKDILEASADKAIKSLLNAQKIKIENYQKKLSSEDFERQIGGYSGYEKYSSVEALEKQDDNELKTFFKVHMLMDTKCTNPKAYTILRLIITACIKIIQAIFPKSIHLIWQLWVLRPKSITMMT